MLLSPQRTDQLIKLVRDCLHFALCWRVADGEPERGNIVAVGGRACKSVGDGVGELLGGDFAGRTLLARRAVGSGESLRALISLRPRRTLRATRIALRALWPLEAGVALRAGRALCAVVALRALRALIARRPLGTLRTARIARLPLRALGTGVALWAGRALSTVIALRALIALRTGRARCAVGTG